MIKHWLAILLLLVCFCSCNKNEDHSRDAVSSKFTLFFVNDVHGHIDNFAKVKHIVDTERKVSDVLVASAGDLFSGNPVVDNHPNKGYPIIDLMNAIGFDIAAIGNHEFDYGADVLKERIEQSVFPWLCANAEALSQEFAQPKAYTTLTVGDLKVTFLGLVETGGSATTTIPSSHPWRVQDYVFTPANSVISDYSHTKSSEDADLLIALSHLGYSGYNSQLGDFQLAQKGFIDMIIGGHSHAIIDTVLYNTPIFQTGAYLNFLGKVEVEVKEKAIGSTKFTLIDLNSYPDFDIDLQNKIGTYNNQPELYEEIGYASQHHSKSATGCFYTHALREYMNADVCFQNTGGVRSTLDQGTIITREIYEISPFNNGTVLYQMPVRDIKAFLRRSGSGFYYSGVSINKVNGAIEIRDSNGHQIPDDYVLKVGVNDYIPAVHANYFPENGEIQALSAAETIIAFLKETNSAIDYSGCNSYFRY